jgi:hypothetical protein
MQEILFTQDITMLDFIIRVSIVIGWIVVMIFAAIQRHKERRDNKKMYEEWLNRHS